MRDVGFLYVLANSAMQGMVKVGKTTRSPAERAAELSAATGLPTPFIVVYEQLFEDCTEAEAFVHALLASKGFRVADNREFFSAPVNEVVRAIALAPGAIDDEDERLVHQPEEGDPSSIWLNIYLEAELNYFGEGEYILNYAEARRLYLKAASLGCVHAYIRLGDIYLNGYGVSADEGKALDYYNKGAKNGALLCYWKIGSHYLHQQGQKDNAIKCFRLFINNYSKNPLSFENDEYEIYSLQRGDLFESCGLVYLRNADDKEMKLPKDITDFIFSKSESVHHIAEFHANSWARRGQKDISAIYFKVAKLFAPSKA